MINVSYLSLKNMKSIYKIFFIIFLVFTICIRFLALKYNSFPHGDIYQEVLIAKTLLDNGLFGVAYPGDIYDAVAHLPNNVVYVTDKPPLWTMLIAVSARIINTKNTFVVAKYLSFITSILFLLVCYLLAKELINKDAAVWFLLIMASNYMLIDFAGNGSRYMLEALLIVSVVWSLIKDKNNWASIFMGLGVMVNYPMAGLIPVVWLIWAFNKKWRNILISIILVGLCLSPWVIYNLKMYHVPILMTNLTRMTGVVSTYFNGERLIMELPDTKESILVTVSAIPLNIIKNWIFFIKKSWIVLPLISVGLLLAIEQYKKWFKNKKLLWLLIVTIIHIVTFSSWRVLKFRYITSFIPLISLIGLVAIYYWKKEWLPWLLKFSLASTIIISTLLYINNPFHTYYYDGVLTEDQFRDKGEYNDMTKMTNNMQFYKQIKLDGVVATDLVRAYLVDKDVYLGDLIEAEKYFNILVNKYQIKYIWQELPIDNEFLARHNNISLVKNDIGNYLYQIR